MGKTKQFMKRTGALLLALAVAATTIGGLEAQAASANKALSVTYSFNGQSYEKDGEKSDYNNNHSITVAGNSKKAVLKKTKLGMDVYIPKTALKKNNSCVSVSMGLDILDNKGEYMAYLPGRIVLNVVKEQGKVNLYGWDTVSEKDVKAAKYGTCKSGTGKYKSFYVIKMKNISLSDKMLLVGDKGTEKVKANAKYAFNVCASVCGENTKDNGKFYLDNMKVMQGTKAIQSITFSTKPDWFSGFVKGKDMNKKKIAIVKF